MKKTNKKQEAWVQKYAPKNINELILSKEHKEYFTDLETLDTNIFLFGDSGIGKTSLSKILVEKFAPNSNLYINASLDNGIDTVRDKITRFIETVSIDGSIKIVSLQECCNFSSAGQAALRELMEQYLDDVKFILTGNYRHKIIPALISRCQTFDLIPDKEGIKEKVKHILRNEKIGLSKDQLNNIRSLIDNTYPDIRKCINELQKCCVTGEFICLGNTNSDIHNKIYSMIHKGENIFSIRKFVIDNEHLFSKDYHGLMRKLFDLFVEEENKLAVMLIAEYMYKDNFALDKEVNFSSLIFSLSEKIKK